MDDMTTHRRHDMSPVLWVTLGYIWGAASVLIAVTFGRAARDTEPRPTVTRVTLHGTDFDEEAFYQWSERGGVN